MIKYAKNTGIDGGNGMSASVFFVHNFSQTTEANKFPFYDMSHLVSKTHLLYSSSCAGLVSKIVRLSLCPLFPPTCSPLFLIVDSLLRLANRTICADNLNSTGKVLIALLTNIEWAKKPAILVSGDSSGNLTHMNQSDTRRSTQGMCATSTTAIGPL